MDADTSVEYQRTLDHRSGDIGGSMQEKKLKEELVRVVHHEVRQHFIRVTGSDVKCYVTPDLSAVVGEGVENGVLYRFSIPVVVTAERLPSDMGVSAMRSVHDPE